MISGHINESDLNDILACGIRVPDHGALNPWSLTVIKDNARSRIGKEILVLNIFKIILKQQKKK